MTDTTMRGLARKAAAIPKSDLYGCEVSGPEAFRDLVQACSPERILAYEDCVKALDYLTGTGGAVDSGVIPASAPSFQEALAKARATLAALDAIGKGEI